MRRSRRGLWEEEEDEEEVHSSTAGGILCLLKMCSAQFNLANRGKLLTFKKLFIFCVWERF